MKWLFAPLLLCFALAAPALGEGMTDAQVRERMIRESLAAYPGRCPCPYFTDRAGRRCGRRSAYSRPGGRSPLCYVRDISKRMVDRYRRRHGIPSANR